MSEINILNHYNGKLYCKADIEKWELPDFINKLLILEGYEHFFLTSSREEEHGDPHVHFTLHPSKSNIVYLLEVETPQIIPKLLHDTLIKLKEKSHDVISSTGFCTNKDLCHFGVFFSASSEINVEELKSAINKIEHVKNVQVFEYTCKSCSEVMKE